MSYDAIDSLVVDGSSLAHRIGNTNVILSNKKGVETSVAFGMIKMLRALIEKFHPKEMVVVWDFKGSYSKKQLYPDYKKKPQRAEQDFEVYNSVIRQIDDLYKILPAFGIKQLRFEGIEADDVIGIISKFFAFSGKQVVVVSSDHDLWQLVTRFTHYAETAGRTSNGKISVYHPQKDFVLDVENFEEKVGFKPEMWVWFRSLTGDPGDNIPGLKWFGEKTSRELLKKFGAWSSWWNENGKVRIEILNSLNKRQKDVILSPEAFTILSISYGLTKVGMLDTGREEEIVRDYISQVPNFDEEAIKSYFLDKEFASILARLHGFIHVFRTMVLHGN